ncbi:MAG: O-antigen ligase family protein [Xenococcaceae cyanobacterium MO_167.B27]|nr:O-antigen ligase family protein [Xenococcaceae cyanobacterium MO_167.B27]
MNNEQSRKRLPKVSTINHRESDYRRSQPLTAFTVKIIGLLATCLYIFFTLVPDSHSLMVLFPFVSLWQIGILLPIFWLLILLWQRKVSFLDNGLDWLIGLIFLSVILSSIFAQFPHQAIWYGASACCYLALVYVINSYLKTPQSRKNLLIKQGYINVSFIIISLTLWITETLLPELDRLAKLKAQGINQAFDFSTIELRNWSPIGHQNYVAGYLLLCLPLLFCLIVIDTKRKRRWWWIIGFGLGLIDLYTTSSRGGWLGFGVTVMFALVFFLFLSSLPRLWLILAVISSLSTVVILAIANKRLLGLLTALFQGKAEGELAYRTINAVLGWNMGLDYPFTGVGLGSAPLLYQKYRPFWAGRESELAFQLHSTPVQLWAEMGLLAVVCSLGAIAIIAFLVTKLLTLQTYLSYIDRILAWCIFSSFLGYGVMSLTDYQLDNVGISGTLALFVAVLASIFAPKADLIPEKNSKFLSIGGLSLAVALLIWLIPVHRAWQLSSQGFNALSQKDTNTFVSKLTKANQLAPWEPYYPYQVGWNLGDLATQNRNPNQIQQAIDWFKKGIAISPYREFGHSNLGWLLLNTNPSEAGKEFKISTQLLPAKRGVFFGVGISLLAQQKTDLAVEAFSLEILRHPLLLTSPAWKSSILQRVYPQVINRLENKYNQLIQQDPNNSTWYRARGSFYWWIGNLEAAKQDWKNSPTALQQITLNIASESSLKGQLDTISSSAIKSLLSAWFNEEQRKQLLKQAWLQATKNEIPPQILEQLTISMAKSNTFEQWLKYNAPAIPYRRKRAGFGVVNRHIDGTIPSDFYLVVENTAFATWFDFLYPSPVYAPDIDRALQPQRDALLENITQ